MRGNGVQLQSTVVNSVTAHNIANPIKDLDLGLDLNLELDRKLVIGESTRVHNLDLLHINCKS